MESFVYKLGLYEKAMPDTLSFRDKLEIVKRCGFDYLELSIDETDKKISRLDMSKEQRRAMVEEMFETGIPVDSLCLSAHRKYPLGSHSRDKEEKSKEILRKSIVLAKELGIRVIMLAGYDVYYEESDILTRQRFLENLKEGVEFASANGVMLAFETMETAFMNTVGKAMDYVTEVSSPYLSVYPDIGNVVNAAFSLGGNWILDLKKGKGHLCSMHLKETRPGIFREVPYGEGHVDFRKAVGQALDLGIRHFVAEFWYDGSSDWEDKIRWNHDFIRKFFR